MFYYVVLLLGTCILTLSEAKPKSVQVHLNSKWPSTPLVLEASEFIAKQSNDLFWKFVDKIAELPPEAYLNDSTDEKRYQLTLGIASKLLTPLQFKLLKFALSLRTYSPAVEMYNQIAREHKISSECNTFVKINSLITCERPAMRAFLQLAKNEPKPDTLKNDHHYPGGEGKPVTVILYGQLMTQAFFEWHSDLRQLAEEGLIDYVLRHYVSNPAQFNTRLSGYGVELAIKNQEYKAKDDTKVEGDAVKSGEDDDGDEDEVQGFIFSDLKKLYPELADNLSEFRQHLIDSSGEMTELKVWEMQDLSLQAAQRAMLAPLEDALSVLQDTSQNFPVQAKLLARIQVREELKQEMQKNQRMWETNVNMMPGDNVLYVNGLQADLDAYDMFTLLDTLRNEARLMEGLHSLAEQYYVKPQLLMDFLKIDMRDTETNYGVDIRDPAVIYVNDLERDKRYMSWPGSVNDLLRPSFPGMLRHIRKNLFHLVFVVNPVNKKHMELLKLAEAFFVHNAPVRIGLVLVVNDSDVATDDTDASVAMWHACNYIFHHETPVKALSFITDIYQAAGDADISSKLVKDQLGQNFPESKLRKVFGPDSVYDVKRSGGSLFVERTGLRSLPQVLVNGVPLRQEQVTPDDLEETIVTTILRLTSDLQKAVFNGFLHDHMDMLEYLMTRTNIMPRLNSRILNPVDKILDLTSPHMPQSVLENPEGFGSLSAANMTSVVSSALRYLAKQDDKSSTRAITVWLVADLSTRAGRALLYNAIKHLKSSSHTRIAVIHNPLSTEPKVATNDEEQLDVFAAYEAAMTAMDTTMARNFVTKLVKEENVEAIRLGEKTLNELAVHNMDVEQFNRAMSHVKSVILKSFRIYCEKVLQFKPGERGLIINGRVLGPLADDEPFITEDFMLLEKYTSKVFVDKLLDKTNALHLDSARASDLLMKASAVIMFSPNKEARKEVKFAGDSHSVLHIPAKDQSGPVYDVVAIMDPLTRAAQKYIPIIAVLHELFDCNVKIFFNCRNKLSELPLKNFYRYVLEPEVTFASDRSLSAGPQAKFHNMPVKPLLTLGMDPPDSWLVEVVKAAYDLDNIYLEEVESIVQAEFELEYILVEGHCFDAQNGQPPRGLQFNLGTELNPTRFDTIVMANLGYFQLKATPGVWQLRLRAGRSKELYEISSHEFTDSPTSDTPDVTIVMDSFKSKIIRVRVQKRPGKEHDELLGGDDDPNGGIWQSISNRFGSAKQDDTETDKTLNIFSVASGHLYERFLRIMMLTVVQHTKSKVKFWFLKNYLSPQFKDFIPHMAKEYGFEVELVQYKWPRWLHHQTEKQRIIWGYKILFLDVLFPLNISKIIYVDADQTVRADLQELADLDLEGAPYGYTPFCDSRTNMDGFRFWKSGYWASHLAGRKYHISALYVVDLKKFRRIAAGDRLRGQYQGLSQDPNSLSNLDQDLPNNMIHQVGIKSLPPEWLWCETWCSDAEKPRAKTIDLCNNPKTKEPKLDAAMRIITEWKDNDQEIKRLYDRVYKSRVAAPTITSPEQPQASVPKKATDEL